MPDPMESADIARSLLPPVAVSSSVRRVAFALATFDDIAVVLGRTVTLAPFRVRNEAVYRIVVPIREGAVTPDAPREDVAPDGAAATTTLTLWPSLHRVDAMNAWASVVTTGIIAVDLVSGVEAIFRHPGGSLTVARNGRVMVRTGPVTPESQDRDLAGASR